MQSLAGAGARLRSSQEGSGVDNKGCYLSLPRPLEATEGLAQGEGIAFLSGKFLSPDCGNRWWVQPYPGGRQGGWESRQRELRNRKIGLDEEQQEEGR